MTLEHDTDGREPLVRRYEYDDRSVIAADLGVRGDTSVDVVDGTAIVVVETDEGEHQEEFDVPADDAQAFIRNGVVTIEVSA